MAQQEMSESTNGTLSSGVVLEGRTQMQNSSKTTRFISKKAQSKKKRRGWAGYQKSNTVEKQNKPVAMDE